ncbi:hypothetical protein H2199_003221 [Coniosporium tulheliwenetii]|uniref:Uncharacterized protein n=1 Tax=Coniosporium tulheliwenetii TaxID=3383036 RepID=A0ACC2ZCN6_9PEZI|nr:hypothetical protein H2199_003221 [Cladosporium sp. JES 115]
MSRQPKALDQVEVAEDGEVVAQGRTVSIHAQMTQDPSSEDMQAKMSTPRGLFKDVNSGSCVMLGLVLLVRKWDLLRAASAEKKQPQDVVSIRTTRTGGAAGRFAESSCPVASISASAHATKASAGLAKFGYPLAATADR